MAVTPSKDYKRREREQRKFDKRVAREAARAVELEAQQAAAELAAADADAALMTAAALGNFAAVENYVHFCRRQNVCWNFLYHYGS